MIRRGTPTHREEICWAAIMVAVAVVVAAAPIPVPAPARASERGVFLLACCELECRWWIFASCGKETGARGVLQSGERPGVSA
jgi:hypothetical protein